MGMKRVACTDISLYISIYLYIYVCVCVCVCVCVRDQHVVIGVQHVLRMRGLNGSADVLRGLTSSVFMYWEG